MKVLSLTQPWATLVAVGAKCIETRSWATPYRGPLAIHASKGFPGWCHDLCTREPFRSALREHGIATWQQLPTGVIIATCRLEGCARIAAPGTALPPRNWCHPPSEPELSFGDYTSGRYAWLLSEAMALPILIPARGSLGLWEFSLEAVSV